MVAKYTKSVYNARCHLAFFTQIVEKDEYNFSNQLHSSVKPANQTKPGLIIDQSH